jgi:DNA-binding CsgD family transcriptional regulator
MSKDAAIVEIYDAALRRFDLRDLDRMQRLLPHVQRALQLRHRLGKLRASDLGFAALDALAIGAIICDTNGGILFANAAAQASVCADEGIVLGGARRGIGVLHRSEGKQLATLVADAANGGAGGAMSVSGRDGARLFVFVAPLPPRFSEQPGHALVTMRPATARPNFQHGVLANVFGLTPAEARLALALLAGRSLAEYGAERGVTENTLRTQLAHVLRKTGTANQRHLVRVLGLLPPLR